MQVIFDTHDIASASDRDAMTLVALMQTIARSADNTEPVPEAMAVATAKHVATDQPAGKPAQAAHQPAKIAPKPAKVAVKNAPHPVKVTGEKPAWLDEPVKVTLVKPAKAAKPDALDHEMVSSLKRKAITKLGRELVQSSKGKQLAELLKENYGTHLVNGLKDEQLEEAYEKMLELQEE